MPGPFFLKQVVWHLQLTYIYQDAQALLTYVKKTILFPIKRSIKSVNIFTKHSGKEQCPKKHTNKSQQFHHTVALSRDTYFDLSLIHVHAYVQNVIIFTIHIKLDIQYSYTFSG